MNTINEQKELLARLVERDYQDYSNEVGALRATQKGYAARMNIASSILTRILNRERPLDERNRNKVRLYFYGRGKKTEIDRVFGEAEYLIAPPNKLLSYVIDRWGSLEEGDVKAIMDIVHKRARSGSTIADPFNGA